MKHEPIAIIGIGCRFPGGSDSPTTFWGNLTRGLDAVGEVPADRWDVRRFYDENTHLPGKIHTTRGGFLKEDIHRFDAPFFGISPREAETMDPQQKLLLEVAYEAIEDAGLDLHDLRGSDTGVFIGGFTLDNQMRLMETECRSVDPHTAVNTTMTMLSSRIAHQFGLQGPCLSIDTACSSSAVALHYACSALRNGESSLAVAGGVNVMLRPGFSVVLTKGHFLSRKGRCSFLDAEADGYVRGEGAGVVLLKPLRQAQADGDVIYAAIRATGVNHNGQTGQSIAVPSAEAQQALIEKVYREAEIDIDSIRYVEAHGTGTQVGDATEVRALDAVFRQGRSEHKRPVGSVKTNLGHLEAAAGVASVIKAALCLHHGQLPPSLHFRNPNPKVDYENLALRVVQEPEELKAPVGALIAVNGFGYGGTNAHLVLQGVEADSSSPQEVCFDTPIPFPISGRSEEAVREIAGQLHGRLSATQGIRRPNTADVLHTLVHRRSRHEVRATCVAESVPDLLKNLKIYAEGGASKAILERRVSGVSVPRLAFLYTGVGTRWGSMGREFYDTYPEFRRSLDTCENLFREVAGWSVLEKILEGDDTPWFQETHIAQPVNFFMQVGLTELLKAHGVVPDVVLGHSLGEVSASYISGVLSLPDAVRVSYHRSRLQQKTAGMGRMLAAQLSVQDAEELLADIEGGCIAAINGPESVTFSGQDASIEALASQLADRDIFHRRLSVDIPYHSAAMEHIEDELVGSLQGLSARTADIPIFSTVSGGPAAGSDYEAEYWYRNVRRPVLFQEAVQRLSQSFSGNEEVVFLEVSPYPVLKASLKQCLAGDGGSKSFCISNKEDSAAIGFTKALAHLHNLGHDLRWSRIQETGSFCKLPTYPFQRTRHWRDAASQDLEPRSTQPFLCTRIDDPDPTWEVELNRQHFPYLEDHQVHGKVVFPGAGYIAAGAELCDEVFGQDGVCRLRDLRFHQLLIRDAAKLQTLRLSHHGESRQFTIHSRRDGSGPWARHFSATLEPETSQHKAPALDLQRLRARMPWTLDSEGIYAKLQGLRLDYGPAFRRIEGDIPKGHREMLVPIRTSCREGETSPGHLLHPAILDACFQAIPLYCGVGLIPHSIDRLTCHAPVPSSSCMAYVEVLQLTEEMVRGNITLCDPDGEVLVEMQGVQGNRLPDWPDEQTSRLDDMLYGFTWAESSLRETLPPVPSGQASWLIFANDSELDRQLVDRAEQAGLQTVVIRRGSKRSQDGPNAYRIRERHPEDLHQLLRRLDLGKFSNILFLWSLECREEPTANWMPLSWLVRSLYASLRKRRLRWMFVMRGSQAVHPDDTSIDLKASSFWGLGRLIANEYSQITTQMLDLEALIPSPQPSRFTEEAEALLDAMQGPVDADHVAFRSGKRFRGRMVKLDHRTEEESTTRCATRESLKIHWQPGDKQVEFRSSPRPEPAAGEVEVLLQSWAPAPAWLGPRADGTSAHSVPWAACFGIVSRVGAESATWLPGEQVLFCTPMDTLGTYVLSRPEHLSRRPAGLDDDLETPFCSFLEAVHGLGDMARLRSGETVLVTHPESATGQAAMVYARRVGATVFADATSPDDRARCREMDVNVLPEAESLTFPQWIRAQVPQGIDLIFRSLPDPIDRAVFALLKKHGQIVDCSGAEAQDGDWLSGPDALRSFRFSRYCLPDLFPVSDALCSTALEYLHEVKGPAARWARRISAAEAHRVFEDAGLATDRYRVDWRDGNVEVAANFEGALFHSGASYCITGGTGGLGWELAKWMVQRGARHLILVSRSGPKDDDIAAAIGRLRKEGVQILVQHCDVARRHELEEMLQRVAHEQPPLEGVFHCATVLDDGFLMDMTPKRFEKVWHAKADGARHLHQLTQHLPLKYFVLMSSVSSLIGNPGQANYVAANGYLDSLAQFRRCQGLPATSIQLGPLKSFGMLARNPSVAKFLKGIGIDGLDRNLTLQCIERALKNAPAQLGCFDIDWHAFQKNFLNNRPVSSSIFHEIYDGNLHQPRHLNKKTAFVDEIAEEAEGKGFLQVLECRLMRTLGDLLKMDPGRLYPSLNFHALGVDSVLTLEFVTMVEKATGFRLSTLDILSGVSIRELATTLESMVHEHGPSRMASAQPA